MIIFLQSSFGECIPIFEGLASNYRDAHRDESYIFSLTELSEAQNFILLTLRPKPYAL
jgi:hypothetical protein